MSVINQVLKDLGARQSRSELRLTDMLGMQSSSLKLSRNRLKLIWPALIILAGAMIAGMLLQQWRQRESTLASALPAEPEAAVTPRLEQATPVTAPAIDSVAVKSEQVAPQAISKPLPKAAPRTRKAAAPSESETQGTEKLEITRHATPASQAANYYRQGLEKLQADRIEPAISDLRKAVALQPDMHAARELLAALLLRSGYSAEAYAELQHGMELEPAHTPYARLYAQSLIEGDQPAAALRILMLSEPYAAQQPDYLAFMAAVAQRLAQHEESVRHYMAALELKPARSAWWVGMAISLEALGRTQEAAHAYRKALAGTELNADLMNYARARLTQLGG